MLRRLEIVFCQVIKQIEKDEYESINLALEKENIVDYTKEQLTNIINYLISIGDSIKIKRKFDVKK